MGITDELRMFAADPYTGWVPTDKQQEDLRAIADRIDERHERELAHLGSEAAGRYVELPVDADGVPIRIGDTVAEPDHMPGGGVVVCMKLYRDRDPWLINCGLWVDPSNCRHVHQDSWECIVEDAMDWDGRERSRADAVVDLVARCERLAR